MSKNTIKTYLLLTVLGGFLVLIGQLLGGAGGATIGLLIAVVFCGGSYWFSDSLAIKAARAQPVTEAEMPDYYRIVRELTQKAGMPMPKLYVSPDMQPNAFATGRNPHHAAVAVTQSGARLIGDGEPLARALGKLETAAKQIPMDVAPAQATLFIINPLTGRKAQFGNLFRTHPPTEDRIARLRGGDWRQ